MTKKTVAITRDWVSPAGRLTIADLNGRLVLVDWTEGWHHTSVTHRVQRLANVTFEPGSTPLTEKTIQELTEYFAGSRHAFDLPLTFFGTDFQKRVWQALQTIAYGHLATYSEVAAAAGSPKAFRATGVAVGENPFSIIVPCHRVVGKDNTLTGYGGGYAAKRLLLALEAGLSEKDLLPDGARKHGREGFR